MKLAQLYSVEITRAKLTDYLLNPAHPDGWSKAKFFRETGLATAEALEAALLKLITANAVTNVTDSPFGKKYIVDGEIIMSADETVRVRTVWIVLTGEDICKFVTAYPL